MGANLSHRPVGPAGARARAGRRAPRCCRVVQGLGASQHSRSDRDARAARPLGQEARERPRQARALALAKRRMRWGPVSLPHGIIRRCALWRATLAGSRARQNAASSCNARGCALATAGCCHLPSPASAEEAPKLAFLEEVLSRSHSFEDKEAFEKAVVVPGDVLAAIDWIAARSERQVCRERRATLERIRARDAELRASGATAAWFAGCDAHVRTIAGSINGPLLVELLDEIGYEDAACVEVFRRGAPLVGPLPCTGNGRPESFPVPLSLPDLAAGAERGNAALLGTLKESSDSAVILTKTIAEAELGRMSHPAPLSAVELDGAVLSPRFGVRQSREDGSEKLRLVDDMSRSRINAASQPTERLGHEAIDALFGTCKAFVTRVGEAPGLWKADIDAAFRRVPLLPEHRALAWVAFLVGTCVYVAQHFAAPFGATSSVHSWERIGAMLSALGRRLIFVPVLRYVDDFFCPERKKGLRDAMRQFAELVRIILGPSAVADGKLLFGNPLGVLGLSVAIDERGLVCWPLPEKRARWRAEIAAALQEGALERGRASKLAGRFCWAASHTFGRFGRALLPPLFEHARARHPSIPAHLRVCLQWWHEALARNFTTTREWQAPDTRSVQLLSDARGNPARVAAVLFIDGRIVFTDVAPPEPLLRLFRERRDNQIGGLEVLSIALGLATFEPLLSGRCVNIFSDNSGSEWAVRSGAAKQFDHNCLVHSIWRMALDANCNLHVQRVASVDNIADLPSRESYSLLYRLGAEWIPPVLDDAWFDPSAWLPHRRP